MLFKLLKFQKMDVLHLTYFTKCDSCDFITERPYQMRKHKRCFLFKCKICNFKTSSKKKYMSHKKDEHIENNNNFQIFKIQMWKMWMWLFNQGTEIA